MKKIILFAFSLAVMASCTEPVKQYTKSSPEIETIKTLHEYFEDSNYDSLQTLYAEDAVIFENSFDSKSISDVIKEGKEGRALIADYTFVDGVKCEMIINDEGETWVNSWAHWKGTLKGSEKVIEIPIISRFQFKDGKIVKEYSYWDNLPSYVAFDELATQKLDNLEQTLEEDE
ncbi:nuclear transport factor 2 family protein [Formosa algae]|uniref:Ketosteroid isomerase-like protein n=1 Tax=Formosa algae TaxID=225843 RepID=A0A9X0YL91_9FLAO|nr:hypothetical protein [Formosa algae]MBP1840847.1 ketosteroid isomerase-like protein [Formosa algae]MDQ0336256.1 ketosteroid isomerase-like protein [Formosa algae]OEI80027.1 hypothetical protein AST99_12150 [Formosa algae]